MDPLETQVPRVQRVTRAFLVKTERRERGALPGSRVSRGCPARMVWTDCAAPRGTLDPPDHLVLMASWAEPVPWVHLARPVPWSRGRRCLDRPDLPDWMGHPACLATLAPRGKWGREETWAPGGPLGRMVCRVPRVCRASRAGWGTWASPGCRGRRETQGWLASWAHPAYRGRLVCLGSRASRGYPGCQEIR